MIKTHNFYIRSLLFFILSLAGAVINYVLYAVLSRVLNLQDFGDFVVITGISNQAMGVLLAFSVISIALVKQYGEEDAKYKAQIIQKILLWMFIWFSGLILLATPFLQRLLNIQHSMSFVVLVLIMLLAIPSNIWTGYLQGHKEQIRVGLFGAIVALSKLVCAVFLALLYGVSGGLWGFLAGSLLGLFVLYYLPGKSVPRIGALFTALNKADKTFLRSYRPYLIQAVFVVTGLVFLQNYGINLAKISFDPNVAGIFSGISVLSNALYYVAFLLIWILLPEFNIKTPVANKRVLFTAYRLIAILAITITVGGLVAGNTVLRLLLGEEFAHYGNTLVAASLYQIGLVSVSLYALYLLVLRQQRSILLAGAVLLSCLMIPVFFVQDPFMMALSLCAAIVAGVLVYWIVYKMIKLLHRAVQ